MKLCLVHGFWGQPSDWQKVLLELSDKDDVYIPDLYSKGRLSPENSIEDWTKHFLQLVKKRWAGQPIDLVAYSMGGRLALHAVHAQPDLFRRVLLLSTRPAIRPDEREERKKWILKWHDQFLNSSWSQLLNSWESQEVFQGTEAIGRRCDDSIRKSLVSSLEKWSLLQHTVDWSDLKKLPDTVDWYFGATDQKLLPLLKDLANLGVKGQKKIINGAGHRILWDKPEVVAQWIRGDIE